MAMKTIKDINLENKKVLIRCDFNVPMKEGKIVDDTRITAALPTIQYALDNNAKVILFSHLGRVKEEADLAKNNLAPVAKRLEELLNQSVTFIEETRGEKLENAINNMKEKDVILVQNTRYEDLDGKKESKNDPELGKYWASLGDVFVNDAFGTIHRAHASNVGIASHLESCIGFLIEKELTALKELDNPEHPFIVVLGGAKVADKIGVIENLVKTADKILIGGGMAFTFLKAEGYEIGNSLLDEENIEFCKNIVKEYPNKIVLPVDVAITTEYSEKEEYKVKDISDLEYNEMGLDIGPNTESLFENYLKDAKIAVWNGPLGVYEFEKYKQGTNHILQFIVDNNIKVILGGGDIVAAASTSGYKDKVYHASTGGGATLEYLEGKTLPGLEAIK
ncbi:MAG TPA: phosphoglycerate kinase [Candidatus Faecimonas intestinavium]|nr:phosphoglycerate kinase [Bacilli bacterium]HIT23007.1 phosphoglycerate kinase [Candidatus Faecimonas intestinavium]